MAAESTQLSVIISLQDELSGKMTGINSSLSKMSTVGAGLKSTFTGIGQRFSTEFGMIEKAAKLGVAGVVAAGAGLVAFGISSVKAFAAAEASQTRFEHAMKQIAKASDAEVEALRKQQDALSMTTRFEDDAIASAQGFLGTFQLNGKQIEMMTPRLLDMAEGLRDNTGASIGLETASNMLGKALQLGTVGMLAKAGVTIPGTTKAMQDLFKAKFEVATLEERTLMLAELVDGNFKGQAVSAGTTLAGQLDILSNSYENVKESIGGALAEGLQPFVQAITSFVTGDQMKQYVADLTVKIHEWIESIGGSEGIKQRMMEFKDKLINEIIPAVERMIEKIVAVARFIWEHREAIIAVVIAWEAFKIAISIVEIIKGVGAAISGLTTIVSGAGSVMSSMAVVTLPLLVAAMAALTVFIIYKAVVAFNDLQKQCEENRKWLDNNSKSLDILQSKVGSLSTENANNQLQNAIDKSREADKSLKDLTERYSGLKGVVMAVADQFYAWGETAWKAIDKVVKKAKEIDSGEGSAWSKIKKLFSASGGIVPQHLAMGGVVYASGGFEARGTDTIPAMLTPGEMVLNSGQQANLFNQLNSGKGRSISVNITGDNYFSGEADEDRLIDKIRLTLSREQERANWGIS